MLIRDLERETGLERATIRYYEREGFITPLRHDNGYREYSPADSETLLKIKLLRQLGMPLEMIRGLQQGSEDFSSAVSDQILALEHKIQDAGRAKEICAELRDTGATYDSLDAAHYLQELESVKPERQSWQPQPVAEFHRPVIAHPWKRYFARRVDFIFFAIFLEFLIIVVLRIRPYLGIVGFVSNFWISYLLWIPVEGLLVHYLRTTPGKWLFGIQIESVNGGPLEISNGIKRAWDTLRYGYGFNLPVYSIWCHYRSYRDYQDLGYAAWDYDRQAEYKFQYYFDTRRKAAMCLVVAVFVGMFVWTLSDVRRMIHRGSELTVAQFSENYNAMVDEMAAENDSVSYDHLNEEGSWEKNFHPVGNAVIIDLSGDMFIPGEETGGGEGLNDFQYEVVDGTMQKLTYDQGWRHITLLSPLDGRAWYAVYTIATAQDWWNLWTANRFENLMKAELTRPAGTVMFENLEITWKIDSENCSVSAGRYTDTDLGISTVILHLEIIIHTA